MKNLIFALVALININIIPVLFAADVYIDDGFLHRIDDDTYLYDYVRVDYYNISNYGTHLEIADGADMMFLRPYNNSTVNMTGGNVILLFAWGKSNVTMSGGNVAALDAHNDATVTLSGGYVDTFIRSVNNGTLYIDGTDFEVNGIQLGYGDRLSSLAPLLEQTPDSIEQGYCKGVITGTLADQSPLECEFLVYYQGELAGTGDIIIIPEPTTFLTIALGTLLLKRTGKRITAKPPAQSLPQSAAKGLQ